MFIHLGENVVILSSDVVAILDFKMTKNSDLITELIESHQRNEKLIDIGKQLTKSIVITTDAIYLSPLSPLTLKRRALTVKEFELTEENGSLTS